jgi:hypothetical protein
LSNNNKTICSVLRKSDFKIFVIGILLIGTLIIGPSEISFIYASKHHKTQSVTSVDPLLCWGAGGLMVLSGVPINQVIGAGQAAHAAGVCP